jgi:hypothetical protein
MSTTKGHSHGGVHRFYWMKRRIYRTGRPGLIARSLHRIAGVQYSAGIILSPARAVTLEVAGRRTGHLVPFLVVIAEYGHEQYLVSMLGNNANWVRSVRAADGRAVAAASRYASRKSSPPTGRPSCVATSRSRREPGRTCP